MFEPYMTYIMFPKHLRQRRHFQIVSNLHENVRVYATYMSHEHACIYILNHEQTKDMSARGNTDKDDLVEYLSKRQLEGTTSHDTSLGFMSLHCNALHSLALRCVRFHYIVLCTYAHTYIYILASLHYIHCIHYIK